MRKGSLSGDQDWVRIVVCVAMALQLSGCDPLSFLDTPRAAKPRSWRKPARTWICHAVLGGDRIVCSAERRIVTVHLAHVVVAGTTNEEAVVALMRRTMSSREQLATCGQRAHVLLESLARGQEVTLVPDPIDAPGRAEARVLLYGGIDVGRRLVQEGVAMLARSSNAPAEYRDDEQRAIETERGIWQPALSADKRFRIQAQVTLERVGRSRRNDARLDLPPLHAADLVQPPRLSFEETEEESESVAMYCYARVEVTAAGPPREHTLVVSLEPRVRGTDLSGPLTSLERLDVSAVEEELVLRGGETHVIELSSEPYELYRVLRAERAVYSGHLIDGYLLRVYYEGAIVYSARGEFDLEQTLGELQ